MIEKYSTICASCKEQKLNLVQRYGDLICLECIDYLEGQDIISNLDLYKSEIIFLNEVLKTIITEDLSAKYSDKDIERINTIIEKLDISIDP